MLERISKTIALPEDPLYRRFYRAGGRAYETTRAKLGQRRKWRQNWTSTSGSAAGNKSLMKFLLLDMDRARKQNAVLTCRNARMTCVKSHWQHTLGKSDEQTSEIDAWRRPAGTNASALEQQPRRQYAAAQNPPVSSVAAAIQQHNS